MTTADQMRDELGEFLMQVDLNRTTYDRTGKDAYTKIVRKTVTALTNICLEEQKEGYDIDRLGSWVFVGDNARLTNLDELYWSYVMEEVARDSASYDHYELDYCKRNMEFAGFDKVGIHKLLARADQRAKERIAKLTKEDK